MSEGTLHIYTARHQPATRYVDNYFDPPMVFTRAPKSLLWCHACYKRRRAENCTMQVYYDYVGVWCAPGKGCKSAAERAAKARREFRNRSRGQKRRYAR